MQVIFCVALLYAVTLILFRGIVFDNAAFASQGDTATALSYTHAGEQVEKEEGVAALLIAFCFSGMPIFGYVAFNPHNVCSVQTAVQLKLNLLYVFMLLGLYLLYTLDPPLYRIGWVRQTPRGALPCSAWLPESGDTGW